MSTTSTLEGRKVTRVGRGVYHIDSENQSDITYTVDVFANEGLGNCDCKQFQFWLLPKYVRSRIAFNSLRCKHLLRVRCHVLDLIILSVIEKTETETKTYHGK